MNPSSVLVMENVNINHNMGAVVISSFSSEKAVVEFYGSNTFDDNNCTDSAYSPLHLSQCYVIFYGNTTFLQNKGRYGGGVYAEHTEINFQENLRFLDNEGEYGGALMLSEETSVFIGQFSEVNFDRNYVQKSGGAVYARGSQIFIFLGQKLSFVENKGYDGGAMTLAGDSTIYLEANSTITFVRNHAYHYGGAIYYVDDFTEDYKPAAPTSKCFYGILSAEIMAKYASLTYIYNYIKIVNFSIEFYNNTAQFAGNAIYGGSVDFCKFHVNFKVISNYDDHLYQASVFDSLFHFHKSTQQLSLISSNPTRVCLCTNMSIPDCNITEYTITAYPGETFTIPAIAVGQRFGTVPSTVHSNFADLLTDNGRLPELQYTQLVNVNCTNLMYTIHSSPNRTEVMELTVEKHNVPQDMLISHA